MTGRCECCGSTEIVSISERWDNADQELCDACRITLERIAAGFPAMVREQAKQLAASNASAA